MLTRSQTKRIIRQCRIRSKTPLQDRKLLYIARVHGSNCYFKFGCSKNPYTRVTNRQFGKCPRAIAHLVHDPQKRYVKHIFEETDNTSIDAFHFEKKFHSDYEEDHIAGEWLHQTKMLFVKDLCEKHGFRMIL